MDWKGFDEYYSKYFNEMGFSILQVSLQGMNSGTFYSRKNGTLNGHPWGTPEHTKLFNAYAKNIEQHLKSKGLLDKAFVCEFFIFHCFTFSFY